jgi:hypothetical protein
MTYISFASQHCFVQQPSHGQQSWTHTQGATQGHRRMFTHVHGTLAPKKHLQGILRTDRSSTSLRSQVLSRCEWTASSSAHTSERGGTSQATRKSPVRASWAARPACAGTRERLGARANRVQGVCAARAASRARGVRASASDGAARRGGERADRECEEGRCTRIDDDRGAGLAKEGG